MLLDQVAQCLVQPDLDCLQGQGIHYVSGQPVPVPLYPFCKKLILYMQYKSLRLSREVLDVLSLETLKVWLDEALST